MSSKICANNASADECPGYKELDCTGCLNEYSCDWDPEECNYTPDPYGRKEDDGR